MKLRDASLDQSACADRRRHGRAIFVPRATMTSYEDSPVDCYARFLRTRQSRIHSYLGVRSERGIRWKTRHLLSSSCSQEREASQQERQCGVVAAVMCVTQKTAKFFVVRIFCDCPEKSTIRNFVLQRQDELQKLVTVGNFHKILRTVCDY